MKLHILGICGTFMGGLAVIAREAGFTVSGSDANVYPPMSEQLAGMGIALGEGYGPEHLQPHPDQVVIGNALSRGNPALEYVLNNKLDFRSGAQWLSEQVLKKRRVLAVAGTHGKTSTASMLAWILEFAQLSPGFLIGGVPANFGISARLGDGDFFVVEADEYDTAFFDKRSKFVHYAAEVAILNNLEFDHADIFNNLGDIKRQFHHFVRILPETATIVHNNDDVNIQDVLKMGCWSRQSSIGDGAQFNWKKCRADGSCFDVLRGAEIVGRVEWTQCGDHNVRNGVSAIAAAIAVGVNATVACAALSLFEGVARRLQCLGKVRGATVYDDFAHHPTAIATTLEGLRRKVGAARILAVLEPRSNSMRIGAHTAAIAPALAAADRVYLYAPSGVAWDADSVLSELGQPAFAFRDSAPMLEHLAGDLKAGDHVVFMSNGSFDGAPNKFLGHGAV